MKRLGFIFSMLVAIVLIFYIYSHDQYEDDEVSATQELVDYGLRWHCINAIFKGGCYVFTLQDYTNGLVLYLNIQYPYLGAKPDTEIEIYLSRFAHDPDSIIVHRGSKYEAMLIKAMERRSCSILNFHMTDEFITRVSTVIKTRDKTIRLH